jgi:hypothetical protein
MQREILIKGVSLLLLCLFASTASAGWLFRSAGNGYYCRYNDAGANDGWYYTQYCGRYYPYSQIVTNATVTSKAAYTPASWKTELVRTLNAQKENEFFIKAIRESGLQPEQAQNLLAQYGQPAASFNSASYIRGTTQYTSGIPYAQQGTTLYGLAAYAPNIGQVNIEGILAQQARLAEQLSGVAGQTNLAFNDRVNQISEAQLEITKIQEAGRVAVATIQASQTPRTTTHQWEVGGSRQGRQGSQLPTLPPPGQGDSDTRRGDGRPNDGGAGTSVPPGNPNGPPQQRGAIAIIKTEEFFNNACIKCHGVKKVEKDLDLRNFSQWSEEKLDQYADVIWDRVNAEDPRDIMPPPSSGIQPATQEEKRFLREALQ